MPLKVDEAAARRGPLARLWDRPDGACGQDTGRTAGKTRPDGVRCRGSRIPGSAHQRDQGRRSVAAFSLAGVSDDVLDGARDPHEPVGSGGLFVVWRPRRSRPATPGPGRPRSGRFGHQLHILLTTVLPLPSPLFVGEHRSRTVRPLRGLPVPTTMAGSAAGGIARVDRRQAGGRESGPRVRSRPGARAHLPFAGRPLRRRRPHRGLATPAVESPRHDPAAQDGCRHGSA